MKLNPIKLRKAYSQYGADRGRPSFLPEDRAATVKLRLVRLRLDSGGYDSGGAYWGLRQRGQRLYWAESEDEFDLGPLAHPPRGTIELTVDALDRQEAKKKIAALLPNVRFYR